jgi:hypothetical protein
MQPGTLNVIQDHRWLIEVVDYYCDGYGSQANGQILHQFARQKHINRVSSPITKQRLFTKQPSNARVSLS